MTAEVRKNSGSVGFRLHLVLICLHTAPEMAVFGITKLDYVSQISFATRDLSVRNPNAIAL
ncbi:MAG: hypothetical protein P4K94_04180, partial [Terracidiphilus sp.]|nr:hypothetical protein [Formivibrio sp.]MDR3750664.1 hypothetical protein [Terracidiphilus sp.]